MRAWQSVLVSVTLRYTNGATIAAKKRTLQPIKWVMTLTRTTWLSAIMKKTRWIANELSTLKAKVELACHWYIAQ